MPIIAHDNISERGKADARRHRKKQKDAVKKQLPSIIAEESIITGKKGKVVKVPIKQLRIPEFKHKSGKKQGGIGQGKGGPGDVIGSRPGHGKEPGKPGTEPGVDYIETEIEIEELIEMMLEDLGLPRLEEKHVRKLVVELGWRLHGVSHAGPQVLRNIPRTKKEGMKRFWFVLRALETETKKDLLLCYRALKKATGNVPKALEFLQDPATELPDEEKIVPFPILTTDDIRYHRIERKTTQKSQAVIFALMDVSGSMTIEKKYYARALLFWLVAFLRQIYEYVEIRFIIHHTIARAVNEEEFFHTGESGGTACYTAYELTGSLIETDYPLSEWNFYVWHFSDGEDFDPRRSTAEVQKLFDKGINMFGYGEIQPEDGASSYPVLLEAFTEAFELEDFTEEDDFKVVASADENHPFIGVIIEKKEHILSSLKAFLKRDRWQR